MNRNYVLILILLLWFAVPIDLVSQNGTIYFEKNLFAELTKTLPIQRDEFFEMKLNSTIQCRGIVIAVGTQGRYKKNYRLVMKDTEAEKMNISIIYYVFFDDEETFSLMPKTGLYQCTGQMMAYTPLNLKRDSYIVDVIQDKGSIVKDK